MKVLLLTPQLPYPPHQGAAVRNYHIARLLSGQADVSILSFAGAHHRPEHELELASFCRSVTVVPAPRRSHSSRALTLFLSKKPDLATRLSSAEFARRLSGLLGEQSFDVVQVEGLEMAQYALPFVPPPSEGLAGMRVAKGPGGPLFVLDEHNAEYVLQRRAFETTSLHDPAATLYSLLQWRKLRLYERQVCRASHGVVAVSTVDRDALLHLDGSLQVEVVPNGVDGSYFAPNSGGEKDGPGAEASPSNPYLLFTGSMDFRPNVDAVVWFVSKIWPLVRAAVPEAGFYVVGRNPLSCIRRLERERGVVVTGQVPDVRPYLARAIACVVPMRMGGGVRLKVLEAMSMGRPVVSTTMGLSGVDCEPGRHALVADTAEAFAAAVCRLLEDRRMGPELGARAAELVRKRYDWRSIVPRLPSIYEELDLRRRGVP